jgi:aryl-alcohol dehydrogenase-like predicted oxidoreductase
VITGATRPEQVVENVEAADVELPTEVVEEIGKILKAE